MREDKTTEALEHFRQVVALRQKVYSTEHPEVAAAYNNLGAALTKAGRLSEAREALSHAQRLYAKTLGPHHLETGNALHNLGILAQKTADEAAAVVYFQGALEAREAGSRRETLDVAMTYATLGASYCHLHDYARCLSAYERALDIRREILGPHHTDVAASLEDVAQVLLALGRPGEALEHYQLALRTVEAAKEQVPYQLVVPLNGMGEVLLAQGKRAEALPYLQRALALAEKSEVEDAWVLATVLETMGDWHLKGGQYRRALPFYQRALALEEKRVPARHPDLFGPLVGVGSASSRSTRPPRPAPRWSGPWRPSPSRASPPSPWPMPVSCWPGLSGRAVTRLGPGHWPRAPRRRSSRSTRTPRPLRSRPGWTHTRSTEPGARRAQTRHRPSLSG
ncbi:tetratricopeptide repeat protein [Cystobacter fuscus]